MKKGQPLMGIFACFIASISWGAMFPVADHALKYMTPFYFSSIRYGAIAVILSVILLLKEGKKAFYLEGKGKSLVFFGTMAFTIYNLLVFLGQMQMGKSGVMVASIMETLMPMISICILWGYKHIKPKKYMITSMLIALVGAMFVITKGDMSFFLTVKDHIFSLGCIFMGVVGWVIYTMGGQTCSGWSTLRYSTLTCLFGTVVTILITVAMTALGYISMPSIGTISIVKYDLIFMMTLPGIIALLAWNYGVKILSLINGILFINLIPITTLVIMMVQGYTITTFDIVGVLLVSTAIIHNNICQRKEENINKQALQKKQVRQAI
ncbi:DMT family transporter [Bacillus thuringiensis]|nr:DMT family transporter [Bacillus thuringiensis]MED2783532.1 DMT family transporter [Bacillus thuringiensis]